MENSISKASIGIDFFLIGAQLHAMYEKNEGGYVALLILLEQTSDSDIPVRDLIGDIKSMARGATDSDTAVGTTQLEKAMTEVAKESGSTFMEPEDIVVKLQMAYLYICKKGKNSVLEHVLQLQVVTKGLVPKTTKPIMDVTDLSISVWNTDRKRIVDKAALVTVDEYLGAAALPDKSQTAK